MGWPTSVSESTPPHPPAGNPLTLRDLSFTFPIFPLLSALTSREPSFTIPVISSAKSWRPSDGELVTLVKTVRLHFHPREQDEKKSPLGLLEETNINCSVLTRGLCFSGLSIYIISLPCIKLGTSWSLNTMRWLVGYLLPAGIPLRLRAPSPFCPQAIRK